MAAFDARGHLYFANPQTGASQWDAPPLHEHGSDGAMIHAVCREVRIQAEPEAEPREAEGERRKLSRFFPNEGIQAEAESEAEAERMERRAAEEGLLWVEGPPALSGHSVCLLGGGTADAAMLVFGGQRRGR